MKLRLAQICHARSGDKADRADIGLFAWGDAGYAALVELVTPQRVADHFEHLFSGREAERVERYSLPNLLALKFVLNGALSGGAAHSLRSDNLGKTIAAQLLRMEVELPDDVANRLITEARRAIDGM